MDLPVAPRLDPRIEHRHYGGAMDLPVMPPVLPMLAKATASIPTDGDFSFEPKWDGFGRC